MNRSCNAIPHHVAEPTTQFPSWVATVPWLTCLAWIAWLAAALPVGATTLEPLTGEELTHRADRVVVAQCTESQSRWHGQSLVTELTFTVSETLAGEESGELVVALPGGIDLDKGIAVTFPGTPSIAPGQDYLLFLHQLSDTELLGVVGLSQGAFPIVYHEGKALVSQSLSNRDGALGLDYVKTRIRSYLHPSNSQR